MTLPGYRGTLLSSDFVERALWRLCAGPLGEGSRDQARARLAAWWRRTAPGLGPALGPRALLDRALAPLLAQLGFRAPASMTPGAGGLLTGGIDGAAGAKAALIVATWGRPLDATWRDAIRCGLREDARWAFCANGERLRLVDASQPYAQRHVEFTIAAAIADERTFALFWAVCRAAALAVSPRPSARRAGGSVLDTIVRLSNAHAAAVSGALHVGVREAVIEILQALAVRRPSHGRDGLVDAFGQSLTIVYRILFLLFAEARGLVPLWHPIYRDSYSIEALRAAIDGPGGGRGLWEALQAISRLAHAGCRAGDLKVTPFNGALFAPARTPLAELRGLDDDRVRLALRALTTRELRGAAARERIAYGDLGVEQIGAVYEGVLDYTPQIAAGRVRLTPGATRRKATGTFYTPRSVTEYLVRATLQPLVAGRSAERILELRVVDPAMGSGAFLVAACRYLAAAYEQALARDGACDPADITAADRAQFRRTIAQRCLFGVDINPMAVQLARLSLWLVTLAADRPLTFLDHHLRVGDSLVGASPDDVARMPPPGAGALSGTRRLAPLPLFDAGDLTSAVEAILPLRDRLALAPDDTVAVVREKERLLATLGGDASPLSRWRALADLWCACWFWPAGTDGPPPAAFGPLADSLFGRRSALPASMGAAWLKVAHGVAAERRPFHWTLEFPEVFFDRAGRRRPDAGFDALLGNPPWEMLRSDAGTPDERTASRALGAHLLRFTRMSGVYRAQPDGQPNCYQLFAERSLQLVASGGRLGLVLPGGIAGDHGSATLRRALFDRCEIDGIVGFDNQLGIFPIHRSVRFVLLTATAGRPTTRLPLRFGERDPTVLDRLEDASAFPVTVTASLLRRLSGDQMAVPDLRSAEDLQILERTAAQFPPVSDAAGWRARFGRELNATEDRVHFVEGGAGLPVVQGKQVTPYRVDARASPFRLPAGRARALLPGRPFERVRLAYRDVASATNRQTLIAALLPAGVVSTHTLFCLKTELPAEAQWFLCGVFNSFVANYLVRQRVTTHVTVAIVERLPVPPPDMESEISRKIAALAERMNTRPSPRTEARLQALVAHAYGLSADEFRHVLSTFPLVEEAARRRAYDEFTGHRGTEAQRNPRGPQGRGRRRPEKPRHEHA